ncbi:NADH dehydrogenase [ubiquinone] 1 subunit C2 [Operophtera brumata]|uniref:NADH dehydrogenase [ubiquinone] 1 subunit C2 n=1 Tax=Operophtera brumata TaxID=104452 RepID=A0A0L7LFM4_OPEBR|nr:NADH dehydrogenase [ubiquinone] 1 subunit C2 [Operophtera brumata]
MSSQLSAIELLKLGDAGRQKPWANYYWPQILGVTIGVCTGSFLNYQTRRPVFSGIQKHIIATIGFTLVLSYVQKKRDDYFAEKDAVYRHYVELHPEDFIEPARKKIGGIMEPWIPIR